MIGKAIVLHDADNVATVVNDVEAGETVDTSKGRLEATETVPFGHKVALVPIARGATVMKYGESIGLARQDISAGEWVHIHNVESQRGRGDLPEKRS